MRLYDFFFSFALLILCFVISFFFFVSFVLSYYDKPICACILFLARGVFFLFPVCLLVYPIMSVCFASFPAGVLDLFLFSCMELHHIYLFCCMWGAPWE